MNIDTTTGGRRLARLAMMATAMMPLAGCSEDLTGSGEFEAQEPFSIAVEVTTQLAVVLNGVNGEIEFAGVTGFDSVRIEGVRRVFSSSAADAEAHLPDIEVVTDLRAGEVGIETEQPSSSNGRNYVVDYQITMPAELMALIENANGNINVESLENTARAQVANGNIVFAEIVGDVLAQTGNGNIICSAILAAAGQASLTTGNGNINLQIPTATSAQFSAAVGTGAITISGLSLQDQTVTPNLVTGRLGTGDGQITLATGNGNITAVGF
ncbi:MAG: DUF4097 family beta strand repeat-containing protein [Gemmatimonadales bacterium]|jgi:hypothetical protein